VAVFYRRLGLLPAQAGVGTTVGHVLWESARFEALGLAAH
jgi:hypothetical protein